MKIQNCRILKSDCLFWVNDWKTTIQLELSDVDGKCKEDFLTGGNSSNDCPAIKKIFQFAGAVVSSELRGKVIREVINSTNDVVGYGDLIADEFFLKVNPERTYTEEELKEMIL